MPLLESAYWFFCYLLRVMLFLMREELYMVLGENPPFPRGEKGLIIP